MAEDLGTLIGYLNELIAAASTPELNIISFLLTFLAVLIVAGTIGQLFTRFTKSKFVGFLVTSAASIWLYEQVFVKGSSLLQIIVSIILFVAFLVILALIALALFVKRVPMMFKP